MSYEPDILEHGPLCAYCWEPGHRAFECPEASVDREPLRQRFAAAVRRYFQ